MSWFKKIFCKDKREKWEILMDEVFPPETIRVYANAENFSERDLERVLENKNILPEEKAEIVNIVWQKIEEIRANNP